MTRVISLAMAAVAALWLLAVPPRALAAPAATAGACPALLQHTVPRLQDEKPQALCQYAGRVLLVVNTASYCGYTPQYKSLEQLHERYRDAGLVVLGFPSNDFLQEKGSNREIADFCENTYGVKFPMFARTSVRGRDASPFFRQLADQSGRTPGWNFHKYLIGRNGAVLASYGSSIRPDDPELVKAIERELARR